jgi:hypothetical protein
VAGWGCLDPGPSQAMVKVTIVSRAGGEEPTSKLTRGGRCQVQVAHRLLDLGPQLSAGCRPRPPFLPCPVGLSTGRLHQHSRGGDYTGAEN